MGHRDKTQTLVQNYRRLGLAPRLNAPTGGIEPSKFLCSIKTGNTTSDSLHINGSAAFAATKVDSTEVRVERDPKTGKILKVIRDDEIEIAGRKHKRTNPLGDPLAQIEMDENDNDNPERSLRKGSEFIRQLEQQAAQEQNAIKKRRPRQQSKQEEEWIQKLIEKHGDNTQAMFWDRRLNPMQQSESDLRKRIRIWRERQMQ